MDSEDVTIDDEFEDGSDEAENDFDFVNSAPTQPNPRKKFIDYQQLCDKLYADIKQINNNNPFEKKKKKTKI